jgi:hypothetical protein
VKQIHKTIIGLTFLASTCFGAATIALAWQSHEHSVGSLNIKGLSSMTQANADTACRNAVWSQILVHGLFRDYSHRPYTSISFVKGSVPNVWAHRQQNTCVINATWGYVHGNLY